MRMKRKQARFFFSFYEIIHGFFLQKYLKQTGLPMAQCVSSCVRKREIGNEWGIYYRYNIIAAKKLIHKFMFLFLICLFGDLVIRNHTFKY